LPFEAFISAKPDTGDVSYWALQYLCRKYRIHYAYSLNVLKSQKAGNYPTKSPRVLGLSYSSDLTTTALANGRKSLENELPYSAEELKNIDRWFSGDFFENEDATEHRFKSEAEQFEIIHLALHGITDTTDMFSSRLEFKKEADPVEDGQLYAYELYDMDLSNAQMVVLSACETGIGKLFQGEGQFSIARGFAAAGCHSILMSLWRVDDKSTAELMDYFYKYLKQGIAKDESLRLAKLDFINASNDLRAHPANWAAFITLGDTEPLTFARWYHKWYVWTALVLLILIVPLMRKKSLHPLRSRLFK
jgi:CHAT domain-containing protein